MTAEMAPVAMSSGTDSASGPAQHRKLVDAAQQFEAMFLEQMLKPMHAMSTQDGSDDDGDGESGTLASMGTESLARAIAQAGGFGIARHVVAEVEREHARHEGKEKDQTELKSSPHPPIQAVRRVP